MPTVDPGAPDNVPPSEQLRNMPFHVLSCDVQQGHYQEGDHIGIGDRHLAVTHPLTKIAMRVYDRPQASIREYDIDGRVTEMRTNIEPSIEDNAIVEVMDFVEIFVRAGVSMTDMRDYIGMAFERAIEKEDTNPLVQDRLLHLYNALGGAST